MLKVAVAVAILVLTACGQTTPVASHSSPTATPSSTASPSASASATASATASPSTSPAAAGATRLIVQDYSKNQVRLARFDAVDTASVTGSFVAVVGGKAVVLNVKTLLTITAAGQIQTLGHLAGQPATVVVSPTLSQWVYTISDDKLTSQVHLGSATGDRVIATIASPDGYSFYPPFTWNSSGVYFLKEPTGLGGVGPYLEYRFPLVKMDLSTGHITELTPSCVGEGVLDDGTLLCKLNTGGLEVRPPNGGSHTIQVATATSGGNSVFTHFTLSADGQRFIVARNGNSNPDLVNYQMATADLSGSSAATFGPADFYPDASLPDGRVVADHLCWSFQGNGGPCTASLDGTYLISADGKSKTLFFKLPTGVVVVGYL